MKENTLKFRQMHRQELNTLVDWAAAEGWNPGLHDADIFWATDEQAFIAAELSGEMIGGGSIVSYGGRYGFMGFFIVHPDHRGRGLGEVLWHERLKRLIARLQVPAVIGMDGVFEMQSWYAKGGFNFDGRDLRFEGIAGMSLKTDGTLPLSEVSFKQLDIYDRAHFPTVRSEFLKLWIQSPGSHARALVRNGELAGYGVARPCRTGYKIGPLFADDGKAAEQLFDALCAKIQGEAVYLDVPENNPAALALAHRKGMKEVFGCAKMYYGRAPRLPSEQIFGVTTFEFG